LIDEKGMSVLPVTSMELQHKVSNQRAPTGVPDLDDMLERKGYFRGSSVLISGAAGCGKTILAAAFAEAACKRGERCLFIGFEESTDQITRNVKSVGINFEPWVKKGLLVHRAWRPTQYGMEMHLLRIHKIIEKYKPSNIIIDPITNLITASTEKDVHSMLMRLMDFLKERGVTSVFTSLSNIGEMEESEVGISSLIDSWVLLRYTELFGKRHRGLFVLKARGMAHSPELREMLITSHGIKLGPADALLAYRDRERQPQLDDRAAVPESLRSKGSRRTAALTRRSSRGVR